MATRLGALLLLLGATALAQAPTHTQCVLARNQYLREHRADSDFKAPDPCPAEPVAAPAAPDGPSHTECVIARTKYLKAHREDANRVDPGPCPVDAPEAQATAG
jgi:hypothetical protein